MSRQTRREFLEYSMLAAAAAAAGRATVSTASAAEGSTSPNERIRLAVIGAGIRGKEHLDAWADRNDVEVALICDPDEARCREKADYYESKKNKPRPNFVQDLRRVFDDKSINAVSIAPPNHWHALAAIWALQAGKDVYVEKPVSHNVSEGRRIVDATLKYNKICHVGTQNRSMPGNIEVIQFLREGGLGEVNMARCLCFKPRQSIGVRGEYQVPSTVDIDLWTGPAPLKPLTRKQFHYDWHWQWDYGNGDIGNQGIHEMDVARWGLGVNDLSGNVFSYGGRLGYEDAGETPNTQVAVYDFGDKTLVFEVRGLRTPKYKGADIGLIFYGTKGYLVKTGYFGGGTVFDNDGKKVREFKSGGEKVNFGNFADVVHSRNLKEQNAPILEGHLSTAMCHLGNISYRLGETVPVSEVDKRLAANSNLKTECLETFERVKEHLKANQIDLDKARLNYGAHLKFDGKAEKFTGAGSDRANPMLTREYRKGFEVPASAEKV